MRLTLVAMPWQSLYRPSLPIGVLHSLINRDCPDVEVAEYHGALHWAERLGSVLPYENLVDDYLTISESGIFQGLGEVIFAASLYGDAARRRADIRRIAEEYRLDEHMLTTMHEMADDFVTDAVADVLATEPDVVGFTSTFMQNVPSLAVARRLRRHRPDLRIVFGGANCEGPMGHALHRNHRFVDYVVRGEAEQVFPELLRRIATDQPLSDLPGVCWWDDDRSIANPATTHAVPPALIPVPDYDEWWRVLSGSPLHAYLRPELVVEGSRGCWWGEKHHCTFCGLNGALMTFRSKPAEQFWAEVSGLVERHQILDILACDNILDMAYLRTLVPLMAAADWDLCMHFEVKSNLRPEHLSALAEAGIVLVQPGIESLNAHALDLMDKGVDGTSNIQTLRAVEDNAMTAFWNYLYGFPGERDEDYRAVLDQIPALVHLQPPSGAARIVMERYSPNFDRPELGFSSRRPATFYRYAYDLPDSELFDLAYFFESEQAGIGDDLGAELDKAVDNWQRDYPASTLTAHHDETRLVILDRRQGWTARTQVLTGWQAAAYRVLERPRTAKGLRDGLGRAGHEVGDTEIAAWLESCRAHGLVFTDAGRWIALATRSVPIKFGYSLGTRPDRWEVSA